MTIGTQNRQLITAKLSTPEERAAQAKKRLQTLLPFEEWCAKMKPTPAAMELYHFVRATLERQMREGGLGLAQQDGHQRRTHA
jgi:hypothetical protein